MRLRTRRTFLSALMVVCLIGVSATAAMAAAPVITSLSATSGHVGQNVTINGSGFSGFAAGQVQVLFHGGVAATFTISSDTRIIATVPGGATSGKISVVTPSGTAIAPKSYKVKAASLKLTGFSPTTAPIGATIVITGTDFTNAVSVQIGSKTLVKGTDFTVKSDTEIDAVIPAGSATGRIVVSTLTGTVTSTDRLTIPVLRLSKFTPNTGAVGAVITLTGAGFTGVTVQFKGATAPITVIPVITNDKLMTVAVPAGAKSGKLTVVSPTLGSFTSQARFLVA